MKKKQITNIIVVDASGSMSNKIDEVKGGLKQLFKDIKTDEEKNKNSKTRTVVIDFSSAGDIRTIVDTTNSETLTDYIADSYNTRGMTALYDAVGKGFTYITGKESGVFITIITDGQENDSKEFRVADIKAKIEEGRQKGYGIIFMGTTEDSLKDAVSFGLSKYNTMSFSDSKDGVKFAMKKMSDYRSVYYNAVSSDTSINTDDLINEENKK